MIRLLKTKILVTGLWLGCVWGCGDSGLLGTDTGNPTVAKIQFVGQGSGVMLTEARIVVKAIDFDPMPLCLTEEETEEEGTDDDDEDLPGPFVVDLLANSSIPDTDSFEIVSGSFCEMDLDFDRLDEADVPDGIDADDPIVGNALILEGMRDDGIPFEVRLSQDDKFKLAANSADGFTIEGSESETLLFVGFDLEIWFTGVDLDSAAVSDGVILMDDENNTDLRAAIVANIKQSARLYIDLNANGVLDDDETEEGFVLANGEDEEDDD